MAAIVITLESAIRPSTAATSTQSTVTPSVTAPTPLPAAQSAQGYRRVPLLRLGRGKIEQVNWLRDRHALAVTTALGLWVYTPTFELLHHVPGLISASLSPDGTLMAGIDDLGRAGLWDVRDWRRLTEIKARASPKDMIWSSSGKKLAIQYDEGLWIFDVHHNDLTWIIFDTSVPTIIAHDRPIWLNDEELVGVKSDNSVSVWEHTRAGVKLSQIPHFEGDLRSSRLRATPDGRHLLRLNFVGEDDNQMVLEAFDVETRKQHYTVSGRATRVIEFSPDSKLMLLGAVSGGKATIHEVATGQLRTTLDGHHSVQALAWSPDGSLVATGDWSYQTEQGVIRLWDPHTGQLFKTILRDFGIVHLAWDREGKRLSSHTWDGTLEIWDTSTLVAMGQLIGAADEHMLLYLATTFNADWSRIAAADARGRIHVWDIESGKHITTLPGHGLPVTHIAWRPNDPNLLASSAGRDFFQTSDRVIKVWDVHHNVPLSEILHNGSVSGMTWNHDGTMLASTDYHGWIRLWSIETMRLSKVVVTYDGNHAYDPRFSADSSMLMAYMGWSGGGCTAIFAVALGQIDPECIGLRKGAVGYSPYVSVLWETTGHNFLTLTTNEEGVKEPPIYGTVVRYMQISPDGSLVEASAHHLEKHSAIVRGIDISPDQRYILSTQSEPYKSYLWNVKSGAVVQEFYGNYFPIPYWSPTTHAVLLSSRDDFGLTFVDLENPDFSDQRFIHDVASAFWSGDGRWFAVQDKTTSRVRLFDGKTGAELDRWAGHRGDLRWSSDNRLIAQVAPGVVSVWAVGDE